MSKNLLHKGHTEFILFHLIKQSLQNKCEQVFGETFLLNREQ